VNNIVSQARIIALEYLDGLAVESTTNVKKVGRHVGWITYIVLACTTPHQMSYLVEKSTFSWNTAPHILESISYILICGCLPIAVDLFIVCCIRICATRGMHRGVKKAALILMVFPVVVSGFVNISAAATRWWAVVFAAAVMMIPMGEGLAAYARPDFKEIQKLEDEIIAQVVVEVVDEIQSRVDPDTAQRRRAEKAKVTTERRKLYAGKTAIELRAEIVERNKNGASLRLSGSKDVLVTRLVNHDREQDEILEALDGTYVPTNAPVSPAGALVS